jgi:hypothetical protein
MKSSIDRIKLFFLAVFAVACALIWGYEVFYVQPRDRCEAHGDWWDWRDRVCAVPMPIWAITGRHAGPEHPIPGAAAPKAAPAKPVSGSAGAARRP